MFLVLVTGVIGQKQTHVSTRSHERRLPNSAQSQISIITEVVAQPLTMATTRDEELCRHSYEQPVDNQCRAQEASSKPYLTVWALLSWTANLDEFVEQFSS